MKFRIYSHAPPQLFNASLTATANVNASLTPIPPFHPPNASLADPWQLPNDSSSNMQIISFAWQNC